jgi:hypothetical protein
MMELGTVTEIKDRLLSVQLEENEGCAACSNASCKDKRQSIKVYNRDGLDIREVQGRAQLSGAFWVLGMPLALLVGGYVAGRSLFPGADEGPAALCGIAGLAIGMAVGVLIQKGKRIESLPVAVRVMPPGEPAPNSGAPAAAATAEGQLP